MDPTARAETVRDRIHRVRELLADRGASAALLRSRASFAWLTLGGLNHVVVGSEHGAVPILVSPDGAWALAPENEAGRIADEELGGLPIEVRRIAWEDPGAIAAAAGALAGDAVVTDDELGEVLVDLRSQLIASEHDRMRTLADDITTTLDSVLPEVRRGDTEHAVAARLGGGLLAKGIRAPVLLVAADDRIERYRHPIPTDTPILGRVMAVAVGERWGLHAAATRIINLGPPSPEIRRRAAATAEVLEAMRAASRPGATLDEVLAAARRAYEATGFGDEWRLHHQGGTIGYAPRERIATPGDRTQLRAGMAVAWNPSITGTKIEATMIVTDGEPEELAR
jgi:Xaa-Pro dipeptidase